MPINAAHPPNNLVATLSSFITDRLSGVSFAPKSYSEISPNTQSQGSPKKTSWHL
jgi:hypothetical protein